MEGELWWLTQIAKDNNLPVAFALVQTDQTPDTWRRLLAHLDAHACQGVPLYGSVSGRATSMVMGFEGSLHPFVLNPLWQQIAPLPWEQKLARLRDPQVRATLTDMKVVEMAAQVNQEAAFFLRGHGAPVCAGRHGPRQCGLRAPAVDSVVARARPPATTRWPWPTTPCWPTRAPMARATMARACCTSRSSTTATATCRSCTPSCCTRAP
jgi:hypothetical protein